MERILTLALAATCCRLACCPATFLMKTKKSFNTPSVIAPGDVKRHAGLKLSIARHLTYSHHSGC